MSTTQGLPPQVSLRALREALGLTLDQVAERIRDQGIDASKFGLSNVETGRRRASARLMEAWARALGIHLHHIRQERELRQYLAATDSDSADVLEPAA
jgi:transcriptional regulator with XRE-family HTH domain